MTAPPQVTRNHDGSFRIQNVDIESLTRTQRVGLAVRIWDQVRTLLEISGEYQPRDFSVSESTTIGTTRMIDRHAAQAAQTEWSAIKKVRPRLLHRPDILARVESGEIVSIEGISRELGILVRSTLSEGRPSKAKRNSSYYGKGDKFDLAIEPFRRYLLGWKTRGFRFAHVNPKEAKRRLKLMDEVIENLGKAREDLALRSHVATSAAPPEKTRRENG